MLFFLRNILTMISSSFQFPAHNLTVQLSVVQVTVLGLPDARTCAGEFSNFLLLWDTALCMGTAVPCCLILCLVTKLSQHYILWKLWNTTVTFGVSYYERMKLAAIAYKIMPNCSHCQFIHSCFLFITSTFVGDCHILQLVYQRNSRYKFPKMSVSYFQISHWL